MIPVLIPFKTDNGRREQLFNFCRDVVWKSYGYKVIQGTDSSDPFIKSRAINAGLQRVFDSGSDVFISADADSYAPKEQIEQAITLARKTGRMVIPYTRLKEYTKDVTDQALSTGIIPSPNGAADLIRKEWYGLESSVLVIPTKLIKEFGGWDERFYGWGGDDNAFAKKMAIIGHHIDPKMPNYCNHKRGDCHLRIPGWGYHIWHPVDAYGKKANDNNLALYHRWLDARTVEDMKFLEEPVNTTNGKPKYTIYLQDHHKDTYIHHAIASIQKHIKGNYDLVLVDDSKDTQFKLWIKHKYPQLTLVNVPLPGGYLRSMQTMVRTMREFSKERGTIPINWQTDFIATQDIVLDDYYKLLTEHNKGWPISQINFNRPPVWEEERPNMQDYLEQRIKRTRGWSNGKDFEYNGMKYRVHDCGWSDNPSIVNVDALQIDFPQRLNGEYEYGQLHLRHGFLSAREQGRTVVKHVGNIGNGSKYGRTH